MYSSIISNNFFNLFFLLRLIPPKPLNYQRKNNQILYKITHKELPAHSFAVRVNMYSY